MTLEEMMRKYETVNKDRCKGCANPWFFALEDYYQCTTCAKLIVRPLEDEYVPKERAQ